MKKLKRTTATLVAMTLALSLALSLALTGCASDAETETDASDAAAQQEIQSEAVAFPVTVVDDAGREVTIEAEPQRIVSLAPANTEIVYALGLIDRLVGVTTYDDYPPEVTEIEAVGDFVGPNLEAVAATAPDLVLATTGVQQDVLAQLEEAGAVVLAIDPQTIDQLYDAIRMVGDATGTGEVAATVVSSMRNEISQITSALDGVEPVTCFVEIAQEPLFTVGDGTLIDELIALAGGTNIVSEPGYVGYSVEQLLEDDPQVYMATLGSMSDPAQLSERPGFDELTSVKDGRVYVLTDNLVSRPGPRVVEGLREIATALHPEAFAGTQ